MSIYNSELTCLNILLDFIWCLNIKRIFRERKLIFLFLYSFVASEDLSAQQPTDSPLPASDSIPSTTERTTLGPGSPDAPTAGSTTLSLSHNEDQGTQGTGKLFRKAMQHNSLYRFCNQQQCLHAEIDIRCILQKCLRGRVRDFRSPRKFIGKLQKGITHNLIYLLLAIKIVVASHLISKNKTSLYPYKN